MSGVGDVTLPIVAVASRSRAMCWPELHGWWKEAPNPKPVVTRAGLRKAGKRSCQYGQPLDPKLEAPTVNS